MCVYVCVYLCVCVCVLRLLVCLVCAWCLCIWSGAHAEKVQSSAHTFTCLKTAKGTRKQTQRARTSPQRYKDSAYTHTHTHSLDDTTGSTATHTHPPTHTHTHTHTQRRRTTAMTCCRAMSSTRARASLSPSFVSPCASMMYAISSAYMCAGASPPSLLPCACV